MRHDTKEPSPCVLILNTYENYIDKNGSRVRVKNYEWVPGDGSFVYVGEYLK